MELVMSTSTHKFRHGHAVYALKNANDITTLKAISQNLMHANLSVTDGVYGILSETDVRKQIKLLGTGSLSDVQDSKEKLADLLRNILNQLES